VFVPFVWPAEDIPFVPTVRVAELVSDKTQPPSGVVKETPAIERDVESCGWDAVTDPANTAVLLVRSLAGRPLQLPAFSKSLPPAPLQVTGVAMAIPGKKQSIAMPRQKRDSQWTTLEFLEGVPESKTMVIFAIKDPTVKLICWLGTCAGNQWQALQVVFFEIVLRLGPSQVYLPSREKGPM